MHRVGALPMRIAPVHLKILAYTLDLEGFDSSRVLQRCKLPPMDAIREDGDWVHVEVLDRMMAAAIEETGDASFGLIAGKSLALAKAGAITPLVLASPSLRQILEDLLKFAPLTVERTEIELDETDHGTRLLMRPLVKGGVSARFRTELVATSAVQLLRFVGASTSDILRVEFPYAEPTAHLPRYTAIFGPHIAFERSACAIGFSPALLDQAMVSHDPVAYMAAQARATTLLAAMRAGTDLAEQVRQLLLGAFPAQPSVSDTALRLGLNERLLRRQLGLLGTSHADLAQECQRLTAERLLADGQMPLKQVAEALGFSSVHSFHRAFKRWFGLTPSEWKDR